MTTHIQIRSPKGGQGASTVTALLALALHANHTVLCVDVAGTGDLAALFGMPDNPDLTVVETSQSMLCVTHDLVNGLQSAHDYVLWDVGNDELPVDGFQLMVARNCYLAARHLMPPRQVDHLLVVTEPGRALTTLDFQHITSATSVSELPYSTRIARASDAGLLVTRIYPELAITEIIHHAGVAA